MKEKLQPYVEYSDILRFLHYRKSTVEPEVIKQIDDCLEIIYNLANFRYTCEKFVVEYRDDSLFIAENVELPFKSLQKLFENSRHIYVVACTLGLEISRLIKRELSINPAHGVVLDACASMVVDAYAGYIQSTLGKTTNRFSPGYGDVPLETQQVFARLLNMEKKTGIHLTNGNLMIPEKSIVFLTGELIDDVETQSLTCNDCQRECVYRKE